MRFKRLISLVLVTGLFISLAAAQAPEKTSPPAVKDAYVSAQLAKLLEGAPVAVVLRSAFNNWLLVDVSVTNVPATRFVFSLYGFTNEVAAREAFQSESRSFTSSAAVTNAGYDEVFTDNQGRWIGRRGASVVLMNSGPAQEREVVLTALSKNLSAHPAFLPDLIHYAYTMHFGDPAPLRAALSKLKIGKSSEVRFSPIPMLGDNSVSAYVTDSEGTELMLTGKAYDSSEAAKSGLEKDQRMVSVHWNEIQVISGVDVYAYTNYGRMDFQVGPYTLVVYPLRQRGHENLQPVLQKVSSALIGEMK